MPWTRAVQSGKSGLNKALASAFRVHLVSDVPERMCQLPMPTIIDAKRKRMIDAIRQRGVLFIHVPKNAGTSICEGLYGLQTKHSSVAYYARVAPDLLDLPSFALVRDPVERFVSAFRYACAGGTGDRLVAPAFRKRSSGFEGVDCAIEHLKRARNIFDIDHIFRPQSWYAILADGAIAVDHLIPYARIDAVTTLPFLAGSLDIPRLNAGKRSPIRLTEAQEAFIQEFYCEDYGLLAKARHSLS